MLFVSTSAYTVRPTAIFYRGLVGQSLYLSRLQQGMRGYVVHGGALFLFRFVN